MSDVLAGRAATFSKGPEFFGVGFEPCVLEYGKGARVYGWDGTELLDWISSLGAVLLGHPNTSDRLYPDRHEAPANQWARAICQQIWRSAGFSLPHRLEGAVAERLTALLSEHVPGWKGQPLGLRWGKTGSDATAMAVRLARAVTGRRRIVSVGYHGWASEFVSTTPPAWGVTPPQFVWAVPFGEIGPIRFLLAGSTDDAGKPPAVVIIEQPPQPAPEGYWQEVRRLCTEHGALLVLDEVVTGLRYALGGAAERFGIEPDLIAMGKGLGNGVAVSCMVGRREYFDWFSRNDPVFVSSTHFGEAIGLAAASAVLDVWDQRCVDQLWLIGAALRARFFSIGLPTVGYPPVFLTQHESPSHRAFFIREMAKRGILANRPWIPNLAHTFADVNSTVAAAAEVKALMDRTDVEAEMAGKLPAVLFANR